MAKIKTAHGLYTANNNVKISRTHCGAVVSYDQSTIWVGDDALDYDTLNPHFAKTCGAFLPYGGNSYVQPMGNTLLINKPIAHASHNTVFSTLTDSYNPRFAHQPYTWIKNLDKTERMNNGTLFRFLDSGGNPHTLAVFTHGYANFNGRYILFAGDSLDNPANSISGLFTEADSSVNALIKSHNLQPVHADPAAKVIYCYAHCYRPSYAHTGVFQFFKVPYTTIPVDGTLTLGTPVAINVGSEGAGRFHEASPSWYAGLNNAGEACFVTQVENEYAYTGTSATTSRHPGNTIKTANSHRVVFAKYDPTTGVATTLADLKGNEGFVGDVNQATTVAADHLSYYSMTHFEPSPIAGETDKYYAFSPCVDSVSGDIGILLHTWDKALDTFTTEATAMTFNGVDVISDFITHAEAITVSNSYLTLNCALTKSNDDFYVSLFYTHTATDGLALFSVSTEQTLLTMEIDNTDFSALSYHSDVPFPALGYAPQDVDNTKWFVIESSSASLYSWSAAGWVKSANEAGTCRAIGQDQDSRYWALMQNAGDYDDVSAFSNHMLGTFKPFNMSLHLLSADLPTSVSVEFADDSITYAGSNLTKNLTVNAFDTDGVRVAKSVTLKLTGSNAVFQSNNATTLTTTTLAGGDLTVPLTISGAGFINISASFAI